MGREIRRVPNDFNWPLSQTWEGFLLPESLHEDRCPDCTRGYTAAGEWLQTLASRIDMLADDIVQRQRGHAMHPWLAQDGYPPHNHQHQVLRPSEDIIDLIAGLTGQDKGRLLSPLRGGDGYLIARKMVEAAGLPETWGQCATCDGHASLEKYPGQRAEAEAWEPAGPPEGEGWQLWETVSEGSPISPVFTEVDELAGWMSQPERGCHWVPQDVAAKFIADGWAPTGIYTPQTGLVSGVEWVGAQGDGE
jgi:hypothetical protein